MRPVEITMHNFGPYRNETVDFRRLDKLFLISGETGSGKTFIFDAMTYALYGQTSGDRGLLKNESLISKYMESGGDSFVRFTFAIGRTEYRVTRYVLKNSRPKTATALLEVSQGQDLEGRSIFAVKADKKIDGELAGILALKKQEFEQIMMLPQGQFERFIESPSKDKAEILKNVFDVQKFTKIVQDIDSHKKEGDTRLGDLIRQQQDLCGGKTEQELCDSLAQKEQQSQEAEAKESGSSERLAALAAQMAELKKEREAAQKKAAAQEALAEEEAKEGDFARKGAELESARRAEKAGESLRNKCAAEQNRTAKRQAESAAQKSADSAAAEYERAKEDSQKISALEEEIKSLTLEKQRYAELVGKALELERNTAQVEQAAQEYETCKRRLEAKTAEQVHSQSQVPDGMEIDAYLLALKEEQNALLFESRTLAEQQKSARMRQETVQRLDEAESALEQKQRQTAENAGRLQEAKAALDETKRQKEYASLLFQAAEIAKTLKDGVKCPVCGSVHHPEPALLASGVEDYSQRIAGLEAQVGGLDSRGASLAAETARLEEVRASAQKQLQELAETAPLGEIESRLEANGAALQGNTQKQRQFTLLNERIKALAKEINALTADVTQAQVRAEKSAAVAEETRRAFGGESVSSAQLQQKLDAAQQTLAQRTAGRAALLERMTAATGAKEKTAASLAAARAESAEAEQRLEVAEAAFGQKLGESGFASAAALQDAMRSESYMTALESEISAHRQRMADLQTAIATIGDVRAQGELQEEAARLETERSETAAVYQAAKERLAECQREVGKLKSTLEQVKKVRGTIAKLEKQNRLYAYLWDKFVKKTHLDTWALGAYYRSIVRFASHRFEKISNGRYTLLQNMDYQAGRVNSDQSLDLFVLDAYTGEKRDIKTLSGGEKFEVSLSLALAITDTANYTLDSIFIDEGFGTLDESDRDRVMPVLNELKENKTVGIISHVDRFKDEIPSQVLVEKSEKGSYIHIR